MWQLCSSTHLSLSDNFGDSIAVTLSDKICLAVQCTSIKLKERKKKRQAVTIILLLCWPLLPCMLWAEYFALLSYGDDMMTENYMFLFVSQGIHMKKGVHALPAECSYEVSEEALLRRGPCQLLSHFASFIFFSGIKLKHSLDQLSIHQPLGFRTNFSATSKSYSCGLSFFVEHCSLYCQFENVSRTS